MKISALFLSLLCLTASAFSQADEAGNHSEKAPRWPWLVNIETILDAQHTCTGALVSKSQILTTAACIDGEGVLNNTIKVWFQPLEAGLPPIEVEADRQTLEYDPDHKIALLRLKTEVKDRAFARLNLDRKSIKKCKNLLCAYVQRKAAAMNMMLASLEVNSQKVDLSNSWDHLSTDDDTKKLGPAHVYCSVAKNGYNYEDAVIRGSAFLDCKGRLAGLGMPIYHGQFGMAVYNKHIELEPMRAFLLDKIEKTPEKEL